MTKMLVYFILFILQRLGFPQPGESKNIYTYGNAGIVILIVLLSTGIVVFCRRMYFLARHNRELQQKIDAQAERIKRQEENLAACMAGMKKQQEKIEKDSALKNRLVSMIAHDIVTPLRFMNRAGLMLVENREQISDDTYQETIQVIKETGDNLRHMTENMLNWVRHHQEQLKFSAASFELANTIEDIKKAIQATAVAKEVVINNKVKEGLSVYQYADPLKTIIQQLMANAVKFSEKGKIIASAEVQNNIVTVSVKDEGMGMPPDMISHLTDAGMVNDFTNAYENKGHGFGLLIVKQMLRIMNGTINIESGVNKGTTVSVSFPQCLAVA